MKTYKSYLHLEDNKIPKTTHKRRLKKLGATKKEVMVNFSFKLNVFFS